MNDKMVFSVLSFVSVFIYVYIGLFSYGKHKKAQGNRTFLVLCMAYAVWAFAYGFVYLANNLHVFYFWNKLSAFGWCTVSSLILYFVLNITESRFFENKWFRRMLFVPAFFLLVMAFTQFGPNIKTPPNIDTAFYIIEYAYDFSYVLISILILYFWGKNSGSIRIKKQANLILLASIGPFVVNFATQNIILEIFHLKAPNISQLYSVFTVLGIYYAISRYKFLIIPEDIILEQVVNEMMDMILVLDARGKIIKTSKNTASTLQYDKNELIEVGLEGILDQDSKRRIPLYNLKDVEYKYCDINIVKKDNQKIPVNISFQLIHDNNIGDLLGVVVVMQDISLIYELERKNDELEAYVGQLKSTEEELRNRYDINIENERRLRISEERFRTIFEKAPLGINLSDTLTGKFYETNSKYAEITGRTSEEILSTDWMSITHPDDIADNLEKEEELGKKETQNFNMKKRYIKPDGSIVWVNMTVATIEFEDNENPCEVCLVEDITERIRNEEELKDSEYTFRKLFNESADPILLLDNDCIIDCNPATLEIMGVVDKNRLIGMKNSDLSPECQPDGSQSMEKYQKLITQLRSSSKVKFEWWYKKQNGDIFPVEIMLTSILLKGRRVIHAIWRDIEERKQMEKRLEYLNYHDQLTGLYNRRFFEEELARLDVTRNYPLSIVMADVNGLKLMNDSFGHNIGDQLLKKVSIAIEKGCRSDDVVARLGGDEFVILLPNTDQYETERIIKRIKSIIAKEKIGSLDISVSFGYEIKNDWETKAEDVLKGAEDMMYRNKMLEGPSIRNGTINTIMSTLHEKDKREEIHSLRVAQLCKELGRTMKLTDSQIDEIITVGMLHDIGKITLDDHILNNPGELSNEEWEEIKRHPETGYRILNTIIEMSEIAQYVLAHHERWDGAGYPKGLKGEEIPLQSRIISIIDAYDAMTSERSYRHPLSEEVAITELKNNAGHQFDPKLIDTFVNKVLKQSKTGDG